MYEIITRAFEPKAVEILLSLIPILLVVKEYLAYKERERANTLVLFNERYSNDKNIKEVVEYLIMYEDYKTKRGLLYPSPSPSVYQKEIFLRFFEELQIAIEAKSLSKNIVYDMFAHYALVADKHKYFVSDYNNNCWHRFHSFIKEMKIIEGQKYKPIKSSL